VRGQRGGRINRQSARALAIWCTRVEPSTLVVTRSEEAADERNRVEKREYEAFCRPLREDGIPFTERDRLDQAVEGVLEAAGAGDLVLLLGAQGMDRGQEIARSWLRAQGEG
jgi:UDP-N-acetylmuramoyl-L-alanyl-D-glutamate--2,6-diaminopimelate ligase